MAADDVAALDQTLAGLGYTRQQETSGQLVSYQSHYDKQDRAGVFHAFDVHWKVSNRQAFADRFSFEELWERRIPIPALGAHAATVSRVDALILALVHRAAHHPGSRDLLWIHDLHLLAEGMTDEEVRRFADLAGSRGLDDVAREGLTLAHDWFGTRAAEGIITTLGRQPVRRECRVSASSRVQPDRSAAPRSAGSAHLALAVAAREGAPVSSTRLHARQIRRSVEPAAARLVRVARRRWRAEVAQARRRALATLAPSPNQPAFNYV